MFISVCGTDGVWFFLNVYSIIRIRRIGRAGNDRCDVDIVGGSSFQLDEPYGDVCQKIEAAVSQNADILEKITSICQNTAHLRPGYTG